jgi:uncharacterized glyoxalase superfamily protein PhnB
MKDSALQAESLMVSLTVKDLMASRKWYHEVVGFAVENEYEYEGVVRAIGLRAGKVRVLLNQDDGAKGWDRNKGDGMSMTITTDDVDGAAARIKAAGGTLGAEPEDKPWGARMFPITDPDGFRFAISTPL